MVLFHPELIFLGVHKLGIMLTDTLKESFNKHGNSVLIFNLLLAIVVLERKRAS